MEWPEGSEGGLRAIGYAWGQFGDVVEAVLGEVPAVSGGLDRSFDGVTASAILEVVRGDLTSGLEELRVRAEGFARQAKNAAADVEKGKVMLIVFAALTLAAIIQLLWTLFGAVFIPIVEAAARLTIQGILQVLKTVLGQVTVRQAGQGLVKLSATVAKWAAGGAGLMVFVDGVIQGLQIATDGRDGWDTESLKGSAIGGAIGGAAGGVFHGAAKGAGNFFAKEFRHKLPRGWQKTFDIAYPSVYAIGQPAMVALSNPFVFLATKDKDGVMWEGILGALAAPGGGKGNGVTGPGAIIPGQSFLDKLDQLGLGWLKPATAILPGGGEKADSEATALDEKKPLVIPGTTAVPVSIKDSVAVATREIVSSAKSLVGTVFNPVSAARQVIPTESTVRSGLLKFLGGEEKAPVPAGSWNGQPSAAAAGLVNQHPGGGSRGEVSGTPAAQQHLGGVAKGQVSAPAVESRPSTVSGSQPTGTTSTPPHSPSQSGVGPRTEPAAGGQSQNQNATKAPEGVSKQPPTQSRASGEPLSAARTPDRQNMPTSLAITSDRMPATTSDSASPPDRTTTGVTRPSRQTGEPHGHGTADSSLPRNQPREDGDGSPRRPDGVVSRPAPGTTPPRTTPETSGSATSDGPVRPSPAITPPSQAPERPAAAAATPTVGDPVPLPEVVMGEEIKLSDIEVVPLRRGAGRVVGAFFPLDQAEIEVVQSAFKAGAGNPRAYSLVGHGRDGHLWVRRKDRQVVKVNEAGVWRLLTSLVVTDGAAWPAMSDVAIVSCGANNPAAGGLLGKLQKLATKTDYPGELSGTERRARLRKDTPWIEELAGEPSGPFKGGVGIDENGVPYVDLAPPEQQVWSEQLPIRSGDVLDSGADLAGVVGMPEAVVATWRGELTGLWWSEEAEAELVRFLSVFVQQSRRLNESQREPLDVELVVRGVAGGGWAWHTVLEQRLREALLQGGLTPEAVDSLFGWVELSEADGDVPSVGVVVREPPNRLGNGYEAARSLALLYSPGTAELTKASRRRLGWIVQRFMQRWKRGVQATMAVEVRDGERQTVPDDVTSAIWQAARQLGPNAPAQRVSWFVHKYVQLKAVPETAEARIRLTIQGNPHPLDRIPADPGLPFSENALMSPRPQQDQAIGSTANKRKWVDREESEPDELVEITLVDRPPVRNITPKVKAGGETAEVDRWSAKPPASGNLKLSNTDKERMAKFADDLIRRAPVKEGKPWDIRFHVTEYESQLGENSRNLFKLMEKSLLSALGDHRVERTSEMLLLGFDQFEHRVRPIQGNRPSLDIIVHETSGETIQDYRNAQSLDLYFRPYGEDLLKISQRKLFWRVESLAEIVDVNADHQGWLVLDLRSTEDKLPGYEKAIARVVNRAVKRAYPEGPAGRNSEARAVKIETFIRGRIEFRFSVSTGAPALFVDMVNLPAGATLSLPQLAALKAGKEGSLVRADLRSVELDPDGQGEFTYFGELLGKKILTRPYELPDVRITVSLNAFWANESVRKLAREHLAGLLANGMRRVKVTDAEIEKFAYSWFWRRAGVDLKAHVRTHVPPGEPEDGRPPDYYRNAKELKGSFVNPNSAQLSQPVEMRVRLRTEGFLVDLDGAGDEWTILNIEIKGNDRVGPARKARMKEVVHESLKALRKSADKPTADDIMNGYVRIEWDRNSTLTNAHFLIKQSASLEGNVRAAVPDEVRVEGGVVAELVRTGGNRSGGVGFPVPSLDVGGETKLKELDFVPLTYAGRVVGIFFPLVQAEVEVVRSAFAAGAYAGAYSLVGHGRGDGIWVRRKSDRRLMRLNAAGVWRLLSRLLLPDLWPVQPKVMVVSCWVDNPARGGFLGQIRQFAHNDEYPGTLSGSQERARIRKDNPWIEELAGEPSGPVKGGVGFDENGIPYVDLARPPRSNQTFPVFPLTTTEGPVPTREIQKVLPNRKVVGGWSGPVSEDDPSSLLESNKKGLSAFAKLFAANVKVLAGQNREMPDVQLNASAATAQIKAQGPGQFDLLWGHLLNAVREEGLDTDTLGLAFESNYHPKRISDGFGISVLDSPNLSIRSYRATRVLTLLFKMTGSNVGALYDVGIRRLRWMMEGLVQRVDVDEAAVLVMRLVVHREKQGAGLMSSITLQVNKAVRHAKPGVQDGDIEKFIKKHIVFRVIVDPDCKTQLALDIVGPAHKLDEVPRESLSLSWKNVDVGEGTTIESIIKFKPLRAPVWEDSSGRSVEIGTLTEWFAGFSGPHVPWPQPIAQTGLGELDGFLDVVAHNMQVLAEHRRETLDIRLTLSLVEAVRAEFGPRLRQWLENTLWLGLESRWGDARGSGLRFDYSERPEGANNPPGFKITVHRSPNWSPRSYRAARRLELQVLRPARLPEAHRRRLRWMVEGLVKRVRENSDPEWNVRLVVDLRSSDAQPEVLTKGMTREVIAAVREALPGQPEANITKFIRDHIVLFRQSNRRGKPPELFLDIEGPSHGMDSVQADQDLSLSWNRQELVPLLSGRAAEPLDRLSLGEDVNLFSAFTRGLDEESGPQDYAIPSGVDLGGVGFPVPLPEVVGEIGLHEVVFVPLIYADGEVGTFFPLVEAEVAVVQSAFAAGAYSDSYSLVGHGRGDGVWVRLESGGVVRLNASAVWQLLSSLLQPGMWPVLPKVMIVSCWVDNPARGGFLGQVRQFARNDEYPETLSGSQKRARIRQDNPRIEELDGDPSEPVKGGVSFDEKGLPYVDMTPPPRSDRTVPVLPLPEAGGREPGRKIRQRLPPRREVGGWSGPICLDDPSKLLESNEKGLSAFADLFAANIGLLAEWKCEMPDVQLRANAATKEAKAHIIGQFKLLWECLLDAVPINESAAGEMGLTFDRHHDYSHGSRDFAISVIDSKHLPTQSYRAASELTLPITFKEHAEAVSGVGIRRSHWMVSGVDIRRLQWMMEGLVQRVDANNSTVLEIRLVVGLSGLEDGLESLVVTHVNEAVRAAKPLAHDGDIENFIKSHIVFRVLVKPSYHAQLALDIIGPPHELDDVSRKRPLYLSWSNGGQLVASQAEQVTAGLSRDGSPVGEGAATEGPPAIKDIQLTQLKEPLWEASGGRRVEMGTLIEWFSMLSLREQQGPPIAQAGLDELEGLLDVVAHNMKLLAANGREAVDIRLSLNLTEAARKNFGHRLREWLENSVRLGLESRGVDTQGSGLRIECSERDENANNPPGFKIAVHQSPFWSSRSYRAARSLELQMLWYASLPEAHRQRLRWMVEGLVERVRENRYPGAMVRLIVDLRTTKHQVKIHTELATREVVEAVQAALPGEPEENIANFIRDHIAFYRQGRGYQEPGLFLDIQGPAHALDWVKADPDLALSWNTQELVPSLPGPVVELPPDDEEALFSALTTILDEEPGPSSDVVAGGEIVQDEGDFRLSHEGGEER